jgi:lipoprotein-anchoring transpeptidase ErfK/SrfK
MTGVSGPRSPGTTGMLLRVAPLTAACMLGAVSRTDAAVYYWQSSEPGSYQQYQPVQPPRRQKARRTAPKKDEKAKETSANPQGPLIISVSIARQQVKIYDDNGLFAEAPVSTGMPGHPTPMGVFSVIQKHKFHHSNIYSGAPMPYMQRITWSGVAMHAGVLPGYPASHGCIRMPMAFAVKMWNWTKMGARVFVTPSEIPTPASFSHPFLPAVKVAPPPAVVELPPVESHADVKADKGAPAPSEASVELRSTVGHTDRPVVADVPPLPRESTRTADAALRSFATLSDAPANTVARPREEAAIKSAIALSTVAKPDGDSAPNASTKIADAVGRTLPPAASKSEDPDVARAAAGQDQQMASEQKPAASNATEAKAEAKPEHPVAAAKADGDDARPEQPRRSPVKGEEKPAETTIDVAKAEPPKSEDAPKAVEAKAPANTEVPKTETLIAEAPKAAEAAKPVEANTAKTEPAKPEPAKTTDVTTDDKAKIARDVSSNPADAKKDQTRLREAEKPAVSKPEPPKRAGQIAVYISRKDSKLYVRQNFEPLFQVPVTIKESDRPFGTHVFTTEVDKTDPNVLHWSVVSLPVTARVARDDDGERVSSRRRKGAAPPPVEARQPQVSPAEALDRITVPQDAMVRIAEAIATGGSIIVSDQGINQGETGEGTDFIVRLH